MTLPRLYAMMKHWNENPPTHRLLNSLVKTFGKTEKEQSGQEDLAALCAGMGIQVTV